VADAKFQEEEHKGGDIISTKLVADKQRVKGVLKEWHALTEVLTTPIVFHPGGWADTLPEWLKGKVIEERIAMVNNGGWDKATDAEVTCYLYTASLCQALGGDWTEITLFQAAKQMPQLRTALPATPKELSAYQLTELNDLKYKIRNSQIRNRKSKRKENGMPNRKLVMEEHDGSVLVGVLQDGCDPFIKTEQGAIEAVLPHVPDFLKEAQDKWAVAPKNPAYKAPPPPKPAPKPAVTPAPTAKTEELPLLAGTGKTQPAEAPAPEQVPTEEQVEAATKIAEAQGGSREEIEAAAEEKAPEAEVEVTEAPAAPAQIEPEPDAEPAEPAAATPIESEVAEDKVEQEIGERIAQAPAPQSAEPTPSAAAKAGEWDYFLQDGRGPFGDVQAAMDEMGLDKANRPQHNRWDRLSTALKEKIQRRPKG